MDELQALKEFRDRITGAPVGDPARERTMAAVRVLIERELADPPRPARRPAWRRLLVVGFAAAVVAAALAVLPLRQSSPSLVGRALAAIGSGSVLHVVGEMPTGKQLLDLRTGSTTPVVQQEEIWFDEGRGLRRDVTRVGGVIVDDTFQSEAGGWTPHGIVYDCAWIAAHPTEATKARVSCNPSGDNGTTPHVVPRPKPTLDPGLAGFADGYRSALASGAARDGGSGAVGGRPVDWLVFDTSEGPERVALDATTHKPILIDAPNRPQLRVTDIETTDAAAGRFQKPSPDETPVLPSLGRSSDEQQLALDGAAIGAAYPRGVWAGASVGGLPLVSATVQRLVNSYYEHARPTQTGIGLQLQYGSLTANGRRDFTKPYVTVSEAPSPDLAAAYMWGAIRGAPPAPGKLVYEPIPAASTDSTGLAVGFTMVGGRAVAIQASSNDLLLAAARALRPAG